MENTLLGGDFVYVNKLAYGPRLPQSIHEIPWLNVFGIFMRHSINEENNFYSYKRILKFSKVHRNDIIVFNLPQSSFDKFYIKRCIGLPGDTIKICGNNFYINNKQIINPEEMKLKYRIGFDIKKKQEFLNKLDSLAIDYNRDWYYRTKDFREVNLTKKEKSILQNLSCVLNLKSDGIFNEDLKIMPHKGFRIKLDSITFNMFKYIINDLEKYDIKEIGHKYFHNNQEIFNYMFKENYFFMIGDNRDNSSDSRIFGLIPEECIVGVATMIIWSYNKNTMRWSRTFKVLN